MAIDSDIRDQAYHFFIEEAPVLLQKIETGLLTLRTERSTAKIHEIMRAAHSIKGGSASVNLDAIATIAHRLENIIKALYSEQVELDTELETQLLCAYDYLRLPLTEQITIGYFDAEQALSLAEPTFTQLEQRLEKALEEAENYIPSSSELGVNMALSIFEVDVAQGLERLCDVVANPQNYEIGGELRAQAEVFSGFAMLLDLPGFDAIAQTALSAIEAHPDQALLITKLALADFQVGREAVLKGNDTQGGKPSTALLAFVTEEKGEKGDMEDKGDMGDKGDMEEKVLCTNATLEEANDDIYNNIPLLEDVFGSSFANSQTNLDDRIVVTETPQNIDEQLERERDFEETWADFLDEVVNPSEAYLEESDSPDVIDGELLVQGKSILDEVTQKPPLLEEVFGNFIDSSETEASPFNALVHVETNIFPVVASTADNYQEQSEEISTNQDASETLAQAVQSIEELFADLPSLEDTPEVVSGSFVDTPVKNKKKVKTRQRRNDSDVTPKLTLRVDLERLERMNNVVGELTINRNSLSLQNEQLQSSVNGLLSRFSRFQKMVSQLQNLSDQMIVGASVGTQYSQAAKVARLNVEQFNLDYPLGAKPNSNNYHEPSSTVYTKLTVDKSQFDTLEMDSYGALHSRLQGILEEMAQLEEAVEDITLFSKATNQTLEQQRQMQIQLRDELMWARMLPVGEVLNRFPRLLRDLSTTYHKPVNLKLNGTGVLVDRAVLEKLYDPLVHLIRNAFDHGIEASDIRQQLGKAEQGQIEISAYHKGNQTIIELKDDGRGIQPELIRIRAVERGLFSAEQVSKLDEDEVIQLIFESGFSTATQVTELSGRGVGLDVLREQMRSLKGKVSLTSTPGIGTTFTLRLPLTLTIAQLLICSVGSSTLGFPSESIEEIVIPKTNQVKQSGKQRFLYWREQLLPVYRVTDLLDYACPLPTTASSKVLMAVPSPEDWALPMLVFKQGQQFFVLEIERLITEQELVIKPFGAALLPPSYTYGCTILGDGSLIPVIDGVELLSDYQEGESETTSPPEYIPLRSNSLTSTILVVDDSVALRRTLALSLEKAGFRVLQARDGREAIEELQKNPATNLVICDIEMPNMNGFDFLNYRRENPQLSKIPVMMLTSRSNNKHRWLAMHLGATDYFTKPYIEQTFLKVIKDIISQQ